MSDNTATDKDSMTREERLAAKLRENLRRRKTQARAMSQQPQASEEDAGEESAGEEATLPKKREGG